MKYLMANIKHKKVNIVDLENLQKVEEMKLGNFIDTIIETYASSTVFIHGLASEGASIIPLLLKQQYTIQKGQKSDKTYKKTESDDFNTIFQIQVNKEHEGQIRTIYFRCSANKIDAKVSEIRDAWCGGSKSLKDVQVVATAVKTLIDKGLTSITIAGDALNCWQNENPLFQKEGKSVIEMRNSWLPALTDFEDNFCRRAYNGGWCYLKDTVKPDDSFAGISLDVNSLYPYIMKDFPLPYGKPVAYQGKYEEDAEYPLYIQEVRFGAVRLKNKKAPCLVRNHPLNFIKTNYIVKEGGIEAILTKPELELILESYDVHNLQYIKGYKFKATTELFKAHVNKYYEIKSTTKGAERQVAKLMLNSLYGKFGTKPYRNKVKYELDENNQEVRKLDNRQKEKVKGLMYVPLAAFITAYGKCETVRAFNANYDNALYSDTDSLKLSCTLEEVKDINIDNKTIGSWKDEGSFTKSRFLGLKCYALKVDNKWNYKIAGVPEEDTQKLDIGFFSIGSKINRTIRRRTSEGAVLAESIFTIGSKFINMV